MNKEFLKRNKKVFLISLSVLVLLVLIFLKTSPTLFKQSNVAQVGLVYDGETLGDLVNRDTDGDGVPDWEEALYGTDPKNPDTFGHGLGDAAEIAKMKAAAGQVPQTQGVENLTETDKFSRELLTSVTALDQTGGMDQDTVDKLTDSVTDQITNPAVNKIFTASDIKTTNDNSAAAVQKYSNALNAVFKKSPGIFQKGYDGITYEIGNGFVNVMQAFQTDENADDSVVSNLTPIINDTQTILSGMEKMTIPVPDQLVSLHVDVINKFEAVLENLSALQEADSDPIVAVGGASKLTDNLDALQTSITTLTSAISTGSKN